MKLCLNMIVKNESARIERALASVVKYIDSWVIVDTGSTDDTKEKIVKFFEAAKIKGEIREEPFEDWSQARNAALSWARKLSFAYEPDYFLLMDADMELVVRDEDAFMKERPGAMYEMYQKAGPVEYTNARLVSAYVHGYYRGVTHEYLDIPSHGAIGMEIAFFNDYADGANRPQKFIRDIRLLRKGLKTEPNNARYFFYLGCSYKEAGQPDKAIKWFQRRIEAGGFEEEVWQAEVHMGHCYKDQKNDAMFIRTLLSAYNRRPTRAEPMFDLATYFRNLPDKQAAALACAEAVEHLKQPDDILFVNNYVYSAGIQEEIAICAYYVPGKRRKGAIATSKLAMSKTPYWLPVNTARQAMYHYLEPLSSYCPSFMAAPIAFTPPPDWVALNPSVCTFSNELYVNIRCVNYRIDDAGRYLIRHVETGEVSRENPITTRNFLARLKSPFSAESDVLEVLPPGNIPCEYPLVVGFEDVRLIPHSGNLLASATVRQIHPDGNCEQVLTNVGWVHPVDLNKRPNGEPELRMTALKRMLRTPRETEKNWAPILEEGAPLRFMWRPGIVVDTEGKVVSKNEPDMRTDNISGSSQVIPFRDGYLAVVHIAQSLPGQDYKRYYYHRFIMYDRDFRVAGVSMPFYFTEKAIEFCAGLCHGPAKDDTLVISYGLKDEQAMIATVSASEVEKMIWESHRL